MYIRKSTYKTDRRTYNRHLLVESVSTPEGPRQKTVCSLGSLSPGPRKKWLTLARRLLAALEKDAGGGAVGPGPPADTAETPVIDPEKIRAEKALEAGPVLAGHAMWVRLQMGKALAKAGLPPKAAKLAQMICLNLLTTTELLLDNGGIKRPWCAIRELLRHTPAGEAGPPARQRLFLLDLPRLSLSPVAFPGPAL